MVHEDPLMVNADPLRVNDDPLMVHEDPLMVHADPPYGPRSAPGRRAVPFIDRVDPSTFRLNAARGPPVSAARACLSQHANVYVSALQVCYARARVYLEISVNMLKWMFSTR
eukprot:427273-Prorocentrum_minimum.AAC.1